MVLIRLANVISLYKLILMPCKFVDNYFKDIFFLFFFFVLEMGGGVFNVRDSLELLWRHRWSSTCIIQSACSVVGNPNPIIIISEFSISEKQWLASTTRFYLFNYSWNYLYFFDEFLGINRHNWSFGWYRLLLSQFHWADVLIVCLYHFSRLLSEQTMQWCHWL